MELKELLGKTIVEIKRDRNVELSFICSDGSEFLMYHSQDCCELVSIDDIVGELDDLIGNPILKAEENSNTTDEKASEWDESWTWTYYHFATIKGYVTIKWYGTSNGYYSESVIFTQTK